MKTKILLLLCSCWMLGSCYKDDVSILYSRQHELEKQLEEIKGQITLINQNIDILNSIVNAGESGDCVIGVEDLPDGSGYKLIFRKGGEKVIHHGNTPYIGGNGNWWIGNTDTGTKASGSTPGVGPNGNWWVDGVDTGVKASGADGAAGQSPVISVARDEANPADPNYYWTTRTGSGPAEFILDAGGNKVKASGIDGPSGTTPVVGVKQDVDGEYYWTVTVAPAAETWLLDGSGHKVKATGKDGADGDSLFKSVDYSHPDHVVFVLNTDPETSFSVAKEKTIAFDVPGGSVVFDGYSRTQVLPFTISDNVVSVQVSAPDGWRTKVDLAAKTVTVTSPAIGNNFAQMSGVLSLVAFDNKGMATSVTTVVEVDGTIHLAFLNNSSNQLTAAQVPYGLKLFYFDQNNPFVKGDLPNDRIPQAEAVSSGAAASKGFNTERENKTRGWTMVTWGDEPNVTWDDYNPSGAAPRDLLDVEASLKPHPTRAGYYLPLAHKNNDMYWQKSTFAKDAAVAAPTQVKRLVASARVTINVHRVDQIMVPGTSTPVDPDKLWVSFDNQGRACQFNSGDVSAKQRGSTPLTVSMAPDMTYNPVSKIATGTFGTFGSLSPISGDMPNRATQIRVMYEDQVIATLQFTNSDAQIDMGSTYEFNINQTTYMAISIKINGWTMVWIDKVFL